MSLQCYSDISFKLRIIDVNSQEGNDCKNISNAITKARIEVCRDDLETITGPVIFRNVVSLLIVQQYTYTETIDDFYGGTSEEGGGGTKYEKFALGELIISCLMEKGEEPEGPRRGEVSAGGGRKNHQ